MNSELLTTSCHAVCIVDTDFLKKDQVSLHSVSLDEKEMTVYLDEKEMELVFPRLYSLLDLKERGFIVDSFMSDSELALCFCYNDPMPSLIKAGYEVIRSGKGDYYAFKAPDWQADSNVSSTEFEL